MSIDHFVRYSAVLHGLTVDFVRAVPEDKWGFTPDPPGKSDRAPAPHRIGDGFAPFCKQLRHVVCVRGVDNAALATRKVDWMGLVKIDTYRTPGGFPSVSKHALHVRALVRTDRGDVTLAGSRSS